MVHPEETAKAMAEQKKLDEGALLFLAQPFSKGREGWNSLANACKTAGGSGYVGVQCPLWDPDLIDVTKGHDSTDYCQERMGIAEENGCPILEVANHVQTDWINFAPAYKPQYAAMMGKDAPIQEMWDHGMDLSM